jgi:hypothetical protein
MGEADRVRPGSYGRKLAVGRRREDRGDGGSGGGSEVDLGDSCYDLVACRLKGQRGGEAWRG